MKLTPPDSNQETGERSYMRKTPGQERPEAARRIGTKHPDSLIWALTYAPGMAPANFMWTRVTAGVVWHRRDTPDTSTPDRG